MGASKCSLEPMKTNSSPQQHHNPRPCDSMRLLLASVLALSSRAHGFLAPGGARVSIHSSNGAGFVKSDVSSVPSLSKRQDGGRARAAGPVSAFGMRSGSKQADAKRDLLDAIAPLEKGIAATEEDVAKVESLAQKLEKMNPNPASLASPLINGRWELVYTTSGSILGKNKPRRLRPNGPIYQDIDAIGLRAKNSQYIRPIRFIKIFNAVKAALTPTSPSAVDVQFLQFRVGPFRIKAPKSAKGSLDTTFVDEELRISRGDRGNLFVLTKPEGLEPDFS